MTAECESRLLGAQCNKYAGHEGPHSAFVLWEDDDPGTSQPTEGDDR